MISPLCGRRSFRTRTLLLEAGVLLLACLHAPGARAVDVGLLGPFTAGDFQTARQSLGSATGADGHPGWSLLNLLLTRDPGQMMALDLPTLGKDADDAWRARWALEKADLAFARGQFRQTLELLDPFLQDQEARQTGAMYLRAGLSWRALGSPQRAREMLASIKPTDPFFPLARYYLGDIALENGDPELALRYFDNAAEAWGGSRSSLVEGGEYRAFLALGRDDRAQVMRAKHDEGSGAGLPWQEPVSAPAAPVAGDRNVIPAAVGQGKFCLQLGAFRDRGLAISLVQRYTGKISGLRIETGRDAQGQPLFRVRAGAYNDPGQARAQAAALQKQYGLEVIIKESE